MCQILLLLWQSLSVKHNDKSVSVPAILRNIATGNLYAAASLFSHSNYALPIYGMLWNVTQFCSPYKSVKK